MTPLEMAIHLQLAEVVEVLCKHGADANHTDKFGNTVLFRALKTRQMDMALTLVSFSFSWSVFKLFGESPCEKTSVESRTRHI